MSQCARFFGYELARRTLRTSLMKFRRLIRSPRKRKQVVGYFDAERFACLEVVDNSNLVGCNSYHALRTKTSTPVVGCQLSAGDSDLLRHVLSNFRQQLARAKRFRDIIVTPGHPRLLSFTAERIRRDCDDRD